MNRLGKFMLRLIGMYIPFVIVILGIGACSYIYKDELLGSAKVGAGWDKKEETVTDETELPEGVGNNEQSPTFDDIVTEPVPTDNGDNEDTTISNSGMESLPAPGECVCPETDGSK